MRPDWKGLAKKYRNLCQKYEHRHGDILGRLIDLADAKERLSAELEEVKAKYADLLDRHLVLQDMLSRKEENKG